MLVGFRDVGGGSLVRPFQGVTISGRGPGRDRSVSSTGTLWCSRWNVAVNHQVSTIPPWSSDGVPPGTVVSPSPLPDPSPRQSCCASPGPSLALPPPSLQLGSGRLHRYGMQLCLRWRMERHADYVTRLPRPPRPARLHRLRGSHGDEPIARPRQLGGCVVPPRRQTRRPCQRCCAIARPIRLGVRAATAIGQGTTIVMQLCSADSGSTCGVGFPVRRLCVWHGLHRLRPWIHGKIEPIARGRQLDPFCVASAVCVALAVRVALAAASGLPSRRTELTRRQSRRLAVCVAFPFASPSPFATNLAVRVALAV